MTIEQAKGYNYGFIEYDDPGAAERAMATLNGRRVHQSVRNIFNWETEILGLHFGKGNPSQLGVPKQSI